MAGSLLKNFKSDLKKNDLLQSQKKKAKSGAAHKDRRERDRKVLSSIREAFNPFDVKTTKKRFETAGSQNGQVGRPGISKQIGQDQRKKAYEAQKRIKNKIGGLLDRRFGENDKSMTEEERMVARYAKEKLRQTRKSQFSLEDDDNEVLTHAGHALAFDDFDEADLKDDLREEEILQPKQQQQQRREAFQSGALGAEDDDGDVQQPERKKSKHEVMKEVIQKSKMYKAQRQNEKADLESMVDELNDPEAFSALMADLNQFDTENKPTRAHGSTDMDYDQAIREMAFDRRAAPGDRTKTGKELEEEASKKAKQLAQARQQRMEGDDLDEGHEADNDAEIFGLHISDEDEENQGNSESEEEMEQVESSTLPKTVADLKSVVKSDPIRELKKLIKQNDPQKAAGNKARLGKLVQLMCKYVCYNPEEFNTVLPLIQDTAEPYSDLLGGYFRNEVSKIHSRSPTLRAADLYTFTLIGCLFSTSDAWHFVANAATIVMTQYLFQQVDLSGSNAGYGLYLCQTLLMYQRISKRYVPEVVSYLLRLFSAVKGNKDAANLVRLAKTTIVLNETKFEKVKDTPLSVSALGKISPERLVLEAINTADDAAELWKSIEAYAEIFTPLKAELEGLPPNSARDALLSKLDKKLKFFLAEREPLRLQELRPVSIVTQVPAFEENFNPEAKYREMDPERAELAKMRAELKRERKSTLKEIRRDTQFETREKLQEKRKEQQDYHSMLSRLTDQIQNEEGAEKNRYEREKLKRKRR